MILRIVSLTRRIAIPALTAMALLFTGVSHAQNTTANMRVITNDVNGNSVAGVAVQITHLPTGRSITLVSNSAGALTARGLAVGGPYQVDTTSNSGYSANALDDVVLELDRTRLVNLFVTSEGGTIEEVVVTAKANTQTLRTGVGRDFDRAKIDATPSISRDFVSALATDPKILVDNSVARGPAISLAGQNFRFNSVTIDGVAQNDNFGLSKNASATQRSPISIDAVEALNVNIAPYDVTYGNFIGGNINIVTKSGTNEFHGSAFYFKTDESLAGNKSDGVSLGIGDFEEDTYGFTIGGPIIKDKLFFFANYEKFETTRPSNTQTLNNISGVTQADIDDVRNIFNTVYGFDPGTFDAADTDEDEKILAKIDWFINDDHRAVATYQIADGDVLFDDFPEIAVLQSNRYNINEKLTAFSGQIFSNWTDNFSTEFKIGFKDVENRQISINSDTPDFAITTPGGGTIAAGGDRFRHTNELDNESRIIRLKGDYEAGNHTITVGLEQEEYTVRNLFLPFSKGQFIFNSIADLQAQDPFIVLYGNSNTGVDADAEARFELAVNSLYVQDEWNVNDEFTVTFGLRYDEYSNDDDITANPNFLARRGFSNQENLDGKDILLPRVGFNWAANDRLTFRGGFGLFGGGTPLIVLSNSYAGDGISRTFAGFFADFFGPETEALITQAGALLPDPNAARTVFQPLTGVNPIGQTDAIDPDFDILSTWKYSVGFDYLADLSVLGLGDDWEISGDVIISDVNDGYDIFEARRSVVGQAPDGRPIYDTPADADYVITNTGRGHGTVVTLDFAKSFDTDYGLFDTTVGVAFQDVDELRSYNRFVTFETLAFDPSTDLNNPGVAQSRFEVPRRITATLNWQKQLFGDNTTSAGLVYAGRDGRHFSYVFGSNGLPTFGGNFLADFGSEGDTPGTHLMYVPTGAADPIVTGDPAFLNDLNLFIEDDDCLSKHRGGVVPRNACDTDWVNIFSLRLAQEVTLKDNFKFDLMLDIENVGNLINDSWGRIDSYTAPSNVAPANVALSADGSQFVLTPGASYDPTAANSSETLVAQPAIARLPSVYRVQFGVRFRF